MAQAQRGWLLRHASGRSKLVAQMPRPAAFASASSAW